MRNGGAAPLATKGAASYPSHLGRRTVDRLQRSTIDEDQAVRAEVRLSGEPGAAPLGDVGPFLLGCVRRFF